MTQLDYNTILGYEGTIEFSVHPTTPIESVIRTVLSIMDSGHSQLPYLTTDDHKYPRDNQWWEINRFEKIFLIRHPDKDYVFILKQKHCKDGLNIFSYRTEDNEEPDEGAYKKALKVVLEMQLSVPHIFMG